MPDRAPETKSKETRVRSFAPDKAAPDSSVIEPQAALADAQRALFNPRDARPADILALQRKAGNRAVSRLLARSSPSPSSVHHGPAVQAKLMVGAAGDEYEQEADQIAEQVLSRPLLAAAGDSGQPDAGGTRRSPIRRQEDEEEIQTQRLQRQEDEDEIQTQRLQRQEDEEEIQTSRGFDPMGSFEAGSDVEAKLAAGRGGGGPLAPDVRDNMESRFGADFGGVRIHTGAEAADLNRELSAQAFTHGQDIYMGEGKYNPGTAAGDRLLAHELAHTIQQAGSIRPLRRSGLTIQREGDDSKKVPEGVRGEARAKFHLGVISKADDESIIAGVEIMAQAGIFGEAAAKATIGNEHGGASIEGSAKGSLQAEGHAKAGLQEQKRKIQVNDEVREVVSSIKALVDLGVLVGATGELAGTLEAHYGILGISASEKLSVFAGAAAKFEGGFEWDTVGRFSWATWMRNITLSGKGEAFAGLKGSSETEVDLKVGRVDLKANVQLQGAMGAGASAEGVLSIGLRGIEASGSAEAFAGMKGSIDFGGSVTYRGEVFVKFTGNITEYLGVGGSVSGTFVFKDGRLVIGGELAAALGIGLGFDVTMEVDFRVLAIMIRDLVFKAFHVEEKRKAQVRAVELAHAVTGETDLPQGETEASVKQKIKAAALPPFSEYARKKRMKGAHGVKREEMQKIVDEHVTANSLLRPLLRTIPANVALTEAAKEACGGLIADISFIGGTIDKFVVSEASVAKEKAKAQILPDFQKYALKKVEQGTQGIKADAVLDIIVDHLFDMPEEILASNAAAIIAGFEEAAREAFGAGLVIAIDFDPLTSAVSLHTFTFTQTDQEKLNAAEIKKLLLPLIQAYVTKKLAKGGHWVKDTELNTLVAGHLPSKAWSTGGTLEGITEAVKEGLGTRVENVAVVLDATAHTVTITYNVKAGEETAILAKKVQDAVQPALVAYAQKKHKKGAHSAKLEEVQSILISKLPNEYYVEVAAVQQGLLAAAKAAFGAGADLQVTVYPLTHTLTVTVFTEGGTVAHDVTKEKVKAAVLPKLVAYGQKKGEKGTQWIKKERVEEIINKAMDAGFYDDVAAISEGVKEAAAAAYGTRLTAFDVTVDATAKHVTVSQFTVAAQASTTGVDLEMIKAALVPPLLAYLQKKGKTGTTWIKELQAAEIIQDKMPTKAWADAALVKDGATQAVQQAYGTYVENVTVTVYALTHKVSVSWTVKATGEHDAEVEAIKALLIQPFQDYARKKELVGAHGLKAEALTAIIKKNVPKRYFGTIVLVDGVKAAATQVFGSHIATLVVEQDGTVTTLTLSESAIKQAVIEKVFPPLERYAGGLGVKKPVQAEVQRIIDGSVAAEYRTTVPGSEGCESAIKLALGTKVTAVKVVGGNITTFTVA